MVTPTYRQFATSFKAFSLFAINKKVPSLNLDCTTPMEVKESLKDLESSADAELIKSLVVFSSGNVGVYYKDDIAREGFFRSLTVMKYIRDNPHKFDPWASEFCKEVITRFPISDNYHVPLNARDEAIVSFIVGFIDALRKACSTRILGVVSYADHK